MKPPKLGIIAGGGVLPLRLVEACRDGGREVFVITFEGVPGTPDFGETPHATARLGEVARAIALLREAKVAEVVLAGPIPRPSLRALKLDSGGLRVLAGLRPGAMGDDKLLSLIVRELETAGFRVVGVDDLLGDLLAPEGVLGRHVPNRDARADIAAGCRVARLLGAVDVGQAVVVQQGVVLGVEAIEGTDALLERCAGLRREGTGGVLVKIRKPGQERRADLPTIGPRTVEMARAAGLRGIAVEAGGSLIVARAAVVEAADAAGLFVVGIDPEQS